MFWNRNKLFAAAVISGLATVYLTNRATLKNADTLRDPNLTLGEKAKMVWKDYILSVGTGAASLGWLFSGRSMAEAKIKDLSRTVLTEDILNYKERQKYDDFRDEVADRVGPRKTVEMEHDSRRRYVMRDPDKTIVAECGPTLCYDMLSRRYFRHDIEAIRKAERAMQENLHAQHVGAGGGCLSVDTFYDYLNIPKWTGCGSVLAFDSEHGFELETSTVEIDGEPCFVLGYVVPPRYDYLGLLRR